MGGSGWATRRMRRGFEISIFLDYGIKIIVLGKWMGDKMSEKMRYLHVTSPIRS
jgi:hypothetical protein